jgi:hypothetical protein
MSFEEPGGMPPDECFQLDANGAPMACVQQTDGSWTPQSVSSGTDPFALFGLASEDGLSATYLASSLRGPAASAPVVRDTAARLRELDRLRDEGLVTETEHASRRAAIIAEL